MCLDRTVNRRKALGRLDYIYWRDGHLLRTGKEHRSEDGVIKTEHRQMQYPRVRGDHDHTLEAEDHHQMTLSGRDIEHHLLDGRALILQALINVTHVRTRLGSSLTITGVPDLQNPQKMTSSGYINDRYVIDSNIFASNGVIHVLQGPLKAPPPPPPSFHPAHQAGMGIGILGLIILIVVAGFVGYNFYTHKTKPFQFHYFKEDEGEDVIPSESSPNISNPVYDAAPATKEQPPTEEDKHQVISSGTFDLLQDS